GSAYVHLESFDGLGVAVLAAIAVGCLAVALMITNNLRDIPTDRRSGKTTLAVRLGDRKTRWLYVGLFAVAVAAVIVLAAWNRPWALLGLAGLGLAVGPIRSVLGGATGPELIPVLGATGRVQMVTGALLALGLAI
ncbi:MAG: UbiA family prenyltransferase, partial [Acidimicrobiales bacterium]|nr:UbiA family prenyltransferase [Acidimicrobiales bacterium]